MLCFVLHIFTPDWPQQHLSQRNNITEFLDKEIHSVSSFMFSIQHQDPEEVPSSVERVNLFLRNHWFLSGSVKTHFKYNNYNTTVTMVICLLSDLQWKSICGWEWAAVWRGVCVWVWVKTIRRLANARLAWPLICRHRSVQLYSVRKVLFIHNLHI